MGIGELGTGESGEEGKGADEDAFAEDGELLRCAEVESRRLCTMTRAAGREVLAKARSRTSAWGAEAAVRLLLLEELHAWPSTPCAALTAILRDMMLLDPHPRRVKVEERQDEGLAKRAVHEKKSSLKPRDLEEWTLYFNRVFASEPIQIFLHFCSIRADKRPCSPGA